MSDSAYPTFQHYGTNAQRLAFTPAPASGTQPIYIWYETDTNNTYIYTTAWKGPYQASGVTGAWSNITGSVTVTGATVSGGVATVVTPGTTVTFSSIPGTYNHLVIEAIARVSDSAVVENYSIQFNGDTGSNYDKEAVYGNSTSAAALASSTPTTFLALGHVPGATATANVPGHAQFRINMYAGTTFYKIIEITSEQFGTLGTASTYFTALWGGLWRSTAAITQISLTDSGGGNFIAGSAFSLYGII